MITVMNINLSQNLEKYYGSNTVILNPQKPPPQWKGGKAVALQILPEVSKNKI